MRGLGNHFGLRVAGGWVKRRNEVQDFEESSIALAVEPSSYIGDSGRVGARLIFESLKSDDPAKTLAPDGRDNVPTVAAYIGYDTRDVLSNPTKGWQNELEVSKTLETRTTGRSPSTCADIKPSNAIAKPSLSTSKRSPRWGFRKQTRSR